MANVELTTERIKAIHWLDKHVAFTCWDDFESGIEQAQAQFLRFVSSPRS